MTRLLLLLGLLCGLLARAGVAASQSVASYRAQLKQTAAALRRLEETPSRPLGTVLQPLAKGATVRRADGQTQSFKGDEWQRRIDTVASAGTGNATRQQVTAARATVALRLKALEEWDKAGYQPAEAQNIVRQLDATGQIQTGPTRLQQFWASLRKQIGAALKAFSDWLNGLLPKNAPALKTPHIDPKVAQLLFIAVVLSLLGVVGYLVWRAIGGRLGRAGARREVRYLEGEDAALLRLPPDELRDRAGRLAREGDFREALRHLYIALLLRLDARGVWRYDTRRTNWEHIAALHGEAIRAPLIAPLSDLTRRFDRVRYGNAACSNDDWTRFAQDVDAVENALSAGGAL